MITIDNLTFSYNKKEKLLFNDLSLHLEEGKIYGLLGKNGAGKTTLFKLISGLLFPFKGDIKIDEVSPGERNELLYNKIFYYPEKMNFPDMKVEEFIELYLPLYDNADKNIFFSLAEEMELPVNKKITQLSHGTAKKFYLAFALAANNQYLLLDEPTTGLDIPSKKDFRKFIAKNFNTEKTIIISSHQVKDFNMLLDEVIIIHNGKLIFKNSIEEIEKRLTVLPVFSDIESYGDNIVYSEEITGGNICLIDNRKGDFDKKPIDLEILFNALITQKEKVLKCFES